AACQRVLTVLREFRAQIDGLGAERVVAVATSAMRDTTNGAEFRDRIASETNINADVIEGDQEARLTFTGASYSAAAANDAPTLVIDIGGGSTELVIGRGDQLDFHTSTQIGAVRQGERHLHSDPPSAGELGTLGDEVQMMIAAAVPPDVLTLARQAVAVAGTPTALAAVDLQLEQFDPWKVHGHTLPIETVEALLAQLAALPLAQRKNVTGLHPDRAGTIVAGAAILLATMRSFGLAAVEVSEHDILYGLLLRAAAS
ncbi:MAG: hypothetical protein JHC87_01955, partial [Thermoleophilaceae bacterium]|nr:hypothetical protein [Thermoleophilaceae bacterium]